MAGVVHAHQVLASPGLRIGKGSVGLADGGRRERGRRGTAAQEVGGALPHAPPHQVGAARPRQQPQPEVRSAEPVAHEEESLEAPFAQQALHGGEHEAGEQVVQVIVVVEDVKRDPVVADRGATMPAAGGGCGRGPHG